MRALFLATPIRAGALISNSVIGQAGELAGSATAVPAEAPIVDVQPHAKAFAPDSRANDAAQRRISRFDAKQQKLDSVLDKNLNICRC